MRAADLNEVRTALRRLLPTGVSSSAGPIVDAHPPLAPVELAATGRMRPVRLKEFFAGRAHARTVLQSLGQHSPVVPVGADRSPRWPHGFVGSISHAGELALAVAAPSAVVRAIGVDVEPSLPLDNDLLSRVCRPEELAYLETSPRPLFQAKLIFSAKESVYKCVAPLTGLFLDFDDLEILFDKGEETFRVRGHGPGGAAIHCNTVVGRYAEAGGYWITVAWQQPLPKSGSVATLPELS